MGAGGYSTARNKRAAQRLRDALLTGDLAVGLCILIGQQKDCIVFRESENLPLKLVGEMVDECNDTLRQLATFLNSYLKSDEYCRRFPSPRALLVDYHLRIEIAMFLTRPKLMAKLADAYDSSKKALKGGEKVKLESAQKTDLFNRAMNETIEQLCDELKPEIDRKMVLVMFATFWLLSNYDIEVPTGAYERAVENLKKQAADENNRGKRAEERLKQMEAKLRDEQKRQTEHVERVKTWLETVKDDLFLKAHPKQNYDFFMQTCILPRVLFSELDAMYCAKLVHLLHQQKTAYHFTVFTIDHTFNNILPLICGLTENEANSLGCYMESLLQLAVRWHGDHEIFKKEFEGFPGSITKNPIDYASFRKLNYNWQSRMTKTFTTVLERDDCDYVAIRNCLIIMARLTPVFPLIQNFVQRMEATVTKVRDREKGKRDDLSLKAASYLGKLKMRNVKIYAEASEFAPITVKKVGGVTAAAAAAKKSEQPEVGVEEPVVKKIRISEHLMANGASEKKKRPKIELYEAPRNREKKKDDKQDAEEGEVDSPSPPPSKKSKVEDDKHKKTASKKKESSNDYVKERKIEVKRKDKENGDAKEEKEGKDVAGPEIPEGLVKRDEKLKAKKHEDSHSRKDRSEKKKDRKSADVKVTKIAEAQHKSRDKEKDRSRITEKRLSNR
ncbi:unnamed protein product [Caenorhabditis bovis]|uniref:THO complex subunitTHOC2 C-terminal domain-containing protein n=1 Tax=Caenorhabditis bovis TaxID=2654633 RepID=A0A8S1EH90_9PELO|nr:unnamed protein product [Caenorhabditis bovis]